MANSAACNGNKDCGFTLWKDEQAGGAKLLAENMATMAVTEFAFAKAPGALRALGDIFAGSKGAVGTWTSVSENMSAKALAYQVSQGGRAGEAFVVNGVKFDGVAGKSLMEAKSSMAQFVGADGAFKPWFNGSKGLAEQAWRQLNAAGDNPIVWRVQDAKTLGAIQKVFENQNITRITLQLSP